MNKIEEREFQQVLNNFMMDLGGLNMSIKSMNKTLEDYKEYHIATYGLDDWLKNEQAYLSKMGK